MKESEDLQVHISSAYLNLVWTAKGIGFGELNIRYDQEKELIVCDSEMMSKDFVRAVLLKLVDKLVTEAIYDGTPEFKSYHEELFKEREKKNSQPSCNFPGNGI